MKATVILNDSMTGASAPMDIEVDSVNQALTVTGNVVKRDAWYESASIEVDHPAGMTTRFNLDASGSVVSKRNV